jgi:hypothetical protein
LTHDPLFVRDLGGHHSVATTEIDIESTMIGAHERMAMTGLAAEMVGDRARLHAVRARVGTFGTAVRALPGRTLTDLTSQT